MLNRLADGSALGAAELREQVPQVAGSIEVSADRPYGGSFAVAPRVLTQLGVEGQIVRGRNAGHWRVSRPQWTLMENWLGETPAPHKSDEGYAELVRRWLGTFGPGTAADIQWWLGATVGIVKAALSDVGAVLVTLDDGRLGHVLPDDLEPVADVEPWAALLPVLDCTVMGWKQRDFFLGPHGAAVFDRFGNAGTTAWWDGRIVGCWVQDPDAVVHIELLEDVGSEALAALTREASRLTAWLDGVRVGSVYSSPAMKQAASSWAAPTVQT